MESLFTKGIYSKSFIACVMIIDAVCIYIAAQILEYKFNFYDQSSFAIWLLLWLVVSIFISSYKKSQLGHLDRICLLAIFGLSIHYLIINFIGIQLIPLDSFYRTLPFYLIVGLFLISVKVGILFFVRFWRNSRGKKISYVIIGFSEIGYCLFQSLKNLKFGYECLGFFDNHEVNDKVIGRVSEVEEFCKRNEVKHIYYALPYHHDEVQKFIKLADNHYMYFGVIYHSGGVVPANVVSAKVKKPLFLDYQSFGVDLQYTPEIYRV